MAKKNEPVQNDNLEKIEETLSKTEQYIEDNQKTLMIIILIIVAVVGGYWAFKNLYLQPQEIDAQGEMFVAQYYFEKDSFNLALNGDGQYLGFADIASDYSMTKAGNLANYYAGVCNLHMGNYEDAIDYLSDFSADDKLVSSIAIGAIGDANIELGNTAEAIDYYLKASSNRDDKTMTPYFLHKAAVACEIGNDFKQALDIYQKIESDYPKSQQARDVKKYIARVQTKL